ncbi:MAG TPA: abortive infection family protein [Acidobacteriota bacterium]|nr:abortive infection family protein [Acidobacteriota bacterium]
MKGLEHLENDYEVAVYLQNTLIGFCTQDQCGGTADDYSRLRRYFLDNPSTKPLVPSWLRVNRDVAQFWNFIKHKFHTYAERRRFIWDEMSRLLSYCESCQPFPAQESISEVVRRFDEAGINTAWQKALERKSSDPEGAITLSRTILESVCKHILDEQGIKYDENRIDLSDLYKMTAKAMHLSPSQHTETVLRQILGGCSGVVGGLGQLRNKLGDAHGKGKRTVRPAPRHAELAVNLAGAMSLFLIETYNASKI